MSFRLEQVEIPIIRDWYEYAVIDSYHRGGETLLLPEEQSILEKLKHGADTPAILDDACIEMVFDWMNKAIQRKYGSSKYLTSGERALFSRLNDTMSAIVAQRASQRVLSSDLVHRERQYQRARRNLVLARRFDELADSAIGFQLEKRFPAIIGDHWQWLLVAAAVTALVVWLRTALLL
jgi:hypothetical protein